jgi:hypothetical protein
MNSDGGWVLLQELFYVKAAPGCQFALAFAKGLICWGVNTQIFRVFGQKG